MIHTLHHSVKGRARYKVKGLYRSQALKQKLEYFLSKEEDILNVSASTLTGNLLISYNSDNTHATIGVVIENLLLKLKEGSVGYDDAQISPPPVENAEDKPAVVAKRPSGAPACAVGAGAGGLKAYVSPSGLPLDKPWHLSDEQAVIELMATQKDFGLSENAVLTRRAQYGANILPSAKERSDMGIFWEQLNSLPTYILSAAAGVSILTGGFVDAVVVMGVVVANAFIGYFTESKAAKVSASIKELVNPSATVIREGAPREIPVDQVVPGDVLVLKPGTYVGADCRVVESKHLSIDESMLTGESLPVFKNPRPLDGEHIPIADHRNMAYMGTHVTGGQGLGVVVATGAFTEMGCLQILLNETETPKTPIERQLAQLGDQLVVICGAICGAFFLLGLLRGYGFLQMLKMAVSLASAAVPEALPAAATINFAIGINNMRKHRVLIRHLQAVETLGAIQTICLDKTGTITLNQMTVSRIYAGGRRIHALDGHFTNDQSPVQPLEIEEVRRLICASTLCNETKINGQCEIGEYELCGSATENALVHLAIRSGLDVLKLCEENTLLKVHHRSEKSLFMSTLHEAPDNCRCLSIKGSPPEVLGMCKWQMIGGQKMALSDESRQAIQTENERMAGDALRVLGVASALNESGDECSLDDELTWLGLVGMSDPVREGVDELIKGFHRAGIETVMITGDQSNTAHAVARELNISGTKPLEVLESSELSAADSEAMEALAKKVHVYSRVSPSHKLRIVQALQKAGKTVSMTGDGVNDGPALKAAELGIAMGQSGTDVAREVADVVLQEDNLETLIIAVRDGRAIHDNIHKSLHFLLSTNLSEVLVLLGAMALGIGIPLSAIQLLWLNIITDIMPGLALSMDEPEPDIMERPPRDSQAPLFSGKDAKRMAYEGGVITASALGAYGFGISRYGMGPTASTLAFQSLINAQLLAAYTSRSKTHSLFDQEKIEPNRYLNWTIAGSVVMQLLAQVFPPLRSFLGLTPIGLTDAAVIGASSLLPLAIFEAGKKKKMETKIEEIKPLEVAYEEQSA